MRVGGQSSASAFRRLDVALRIDSSRAPVRHFRETDGALVHVDYYAKIAFGDVVQQYDTGAEFRPGEEVCAPESVASWKGLIFVDEHPEAKGVTVDNAAQVNRGHILDAWPEYPDVGAKIRVNDRGTIDRIESGKVRLSCGYDVMRPDETPGVFNGTPYVRVQRGIVGNHCALTYLPRGERDGENPRLYTDSTGALVGVQKDTDDVMKKIKLPDGTEVEVPEGVAAFIEGLQAQVASLKPAAPPAEDDPEEAAGDAAGNGQGQPPGQPPKMDSKAVERLVDQRLEQHRADSLAFAEFRSHADAALRREGKSMTFSGDLVADRIAFAEQVLGKDDADVKAARASLRRRADSREVDGELRGLSAGLFRTAVAELRRRHDSTPQQLAGLTHQDSAGDDDGVLGTLTRQHGGPRAA